MKTFFRVTVCATVLSLTCAATAYADDAAPAKEPAAKPEAAKEGEAKTPAKEAAKEEEKKDDAAKLEEQFKLPETNDVAELEKFIESVQTFRPKTLAQAQARFTKGQEAVTAAANKILELEKDTSSAAYKRARQLVFSGRVARIGEASPENQRALLDEILKYFADHELTTQDLMLAMQVGRGLEYSEKHSELAGEAYSSFAKIFAEAKDEKLKERAAMLEGAARRANLLGHEMVIKGLTVDGKPFDWDSYRGKVVLVDFWATWCGPCLAELPNVRKNYELYHDKGFDVVGISLDSDDERLHNFLEKEKLPWATVYEKGSGWKNPNAEYYGISGIPTVILVDKTGKVVSLRARGEKLGELLAEQFGPAEAAAEKSETKAEAKDEAKPDSAAKKE